MIARKGKISMRTECVTVNQPSKHNKGKMIGAGIGTAAGVAYNIHDGKQLLGYINRNLEKIQLKHPNITGTPKDVFQSYLKTHSETGKKGIVFLKNKAQVLKRTGVMAGLVAACAAAGIAVGAVIDKIAASKNKQI